MTFDELFALSPTGAGRWRTAPTPATQEPRLFGGLLIGQAIVAASAGTRRCNALHGFFISVGDKQTAFDVSVDATRDGRSFATRRVEIRQGEKLLLAAYTSHHDGDEGPGHQMDMPDLPPPEGLEDQRVIRARLAEQNGKTATRYLAEDMLDARPVELPQPPAGSTEPARAIWFRPRARFTGGQDLHRAVIGFSSDLGLVRVGLLAHRDDARQDLQAASLDHSLWFHKDADANEWMLHVQRSPAAAFGRGLSQAAIYTRQGVLVASAAQEFLARYKS